MADGTAHAYSRTPHGARGVCLHKLATGTVTVPSIGKGGVVGKGFGCTCTPLANARKHAQIAFDRTLRQIIAVGGPTPGGITPHKKSNPPSLT